MFSKSLFRQSCKANGLMWIIITVAVCFMLSCVMLIAGKGDLGDTKVVIEDAVVEGELTAQTESRAMNYYDITEGALQYFDTKFQEAYNADNGDAAVKTAYAAAAGAVQTEYYPALLQE
ncbi:MAG: hypothetical protein K2L51_03450, partial [Clostridiales bacterium]|nr:hypothetical protein [Clostridiales bacterium]